MTDTAQATSIEYQGRVAIVTLDKPKKLNALTKDDYYALTQALREVAIHDEVFVTLLIGKGCFFSAGADVSVSRVQAPGTDLFRHGLQFTVANNLNNAHAFYTHPKILVVALNGPVVGMSAALVGLADFIYCTPDAYLFTPFSSLGLVTEGVASKAFVARMGAAKAKEALIQSRRIPSSELLACGFVNKIFSECKAGEHDRFRELVLKEIDDRMGQHLNGTSMLRIKQLIESPNRAAYNSHSVEEVFDGLERHVAGIPQKEFERLRTGRKKHKL